MKERDALAAAEQRELQHGSICEIGVGIVSGGMGVNAIYVRRGGKVRLFWKGMWSQGLSHTIAQTLEAWEANQDVAAIKVPVPPPGILPRLREKNPFVPVIPVHLGSKAADAQAFVDVRSEHLWHMREIIRQGQIDIDPEDADLGEQLREIRWEMDTRGRLFVMPKMGEIVLVDALALCFAAVRIEPALPNHLTRATR